MSPLPTNGSSAGAQPLGIKPCHGALGNQIAVEELPHYKTLLVHHKLRRDEQRHHHQKTDMNFHVQQKRYRRAPAQRLSFQSRAPRAAARRAAR